MGDQNMSDLISIHAGFDEVHQGARAKIQQNIVIRAHQIAGGGTARVHIGTGPKNGQLHSSLIDTTTFENRARSVSHIKLLKNVPSLNQVGTGNLLLKPGTDGMQDQFRGIQPVQLSQESAHAHRGSKFEHACILLLRDL